MHVPVCEKQGKLKTNKKRDKRMDPPAIRNEVFARIKLSGAAAVAGLRDVLCGTIGSVNFSKVSGSIRLTSGISINSNWTPSKLVSGRNRLSKLEK